jgi:hypothetical protein
MDAAEQAALLIQLQTEVQTLQAAAAAAALIAAEATAAEAAAAEVAAAEAAAAEDAPVAPPAHGAQPTIPVFTLAPALANNAAFIDLTSANGSKHFNKATEALTKEPFNFADPSDLQVFLDLVLKKSQVWGWNRILIIPVTNNASPAVTSNHNLLDEYGFVSIEAIRTQAETYYATPTKQAQDSIMLYQSLLSSLALDFLKLITADSAQYHLPEIVHADGPVPSGPLLLKLIILQAHVDYRATVSFVRTSLTRLDEKMIELDSNIESFNFYVKSQIKSLSARGEASSDLLINLFKGYKVANDTEFLDFLRRKENAYEEGHDVGPLNLMSESLVKYKARMLVGKWSAPTKEQGQILALTAQVEHLKSTRKSGKTAPSAPQSALTSASKQKQDAGWAWKKKIPQEGEATTKEFDGKQYSVNCKFHPKQWVCHTSAECSKNPANTEDDTTSNPAESNSTSRRLKAAKIAVSLVETDEEDPDEDSEGDGF